MSVLRNYYTYIVECADGTYYIGKTFDLERRLKQHNGLLRGGAKYTYSRRPVVLIYYEVCDSHKHACQREWSLKKLTRLEKEGLIKNFI